MNNISNTIYRICAALVMIILIAWGYWWMIVCAAVAFLFIFEGYYEIILWGVCFDALYDGTGYYATFLSVFLLFIGVFLKKRLSFYGQ